MNEIKDEDTKLFKGKQSFENENKTNVKLPKKSYKTNKLDQEQEIEIDGNEEITKVDDAEKYISENKAKKRLRFGEEKKSPASKEDNEVNKNIANEESDKAQEKVNEEELEEIDSEISKNEDVVKNGVVYEYRDSK